MGNVKMSLVNCFLGTILPDVGPEDLATGSEDNVSACVMRTELVAALKVNLALDILAFKVDRDRLVEGMEEAMACLFDVDYVVSGVSYLHSSDIVLLSSGCWIESTSVKNDDVC